MSAPRFKKISVIGVGLLGGSVALAAKKAGLAREIWGFSQRGARALSAKKKGVISHAGSTLEKTVEAADLIILATPFRYFEGILKKISKAAPASSIVTDVGSVKGSWVTRWENAAKPLRFVGSHPMAGSEKTGFEAAEAGLFVGAPCILTPTPRTDPKALSEIARFWRSLGGKVLQRKPAEHDRIIGMFSHVTHAASFALEASARKNMRAADFSLAGPSFKGATRIAQSDPGLWKDIFSFNREEVIRQLELYERELQALRKLLGSRNEARLGAWLARVSRQARGKKA